MARGVEDTLDRIAVEPSSHDLRPKLQRRLPSRARRPVRSQLGHGVVGVGRAEDSPGRGDGVA